jgi:hypothetical protein
MHCRTINARTFSQLQVSVVRWMYIQVAKTRLPASVRSLTAVVRMRVYVWVCVFAHVRVNVLFKPGLPGPKNLKKAEYDKKQLGKGQILVPQILKKLKRPNKVQLFFKICSKQESKLKFYKIFQILLRFILALKYTLFFNI